GTGNSATGGAIGSGGSATGSGGTTSGDGGAETGAGGGPDSTGGAGGSSSTGGTGSGGGGSTALFSSDFEADAGGAVMSGGPTWTTTLPTTYDSAGVVSVVDDTSAHSGSKSVYVKKGNDGQAFLQLTDASVF